jgi:hypothetical protein
MRVMSILLSAAVITFSGNVLSAQVASSTAPAAKPNFAGTWTLIPDTAAAAQFSTRVSALAGLGSEVTIAQNEKTMTVSRPTDAGVLSSVFNLDGSESRNTLAVGPGTDIPLTARSRWEGEKLLTNMTAVFGDQQFELTMNLSLTPANVLVVEMTTPPMGGAPSAFTMRYRKNE